MAETVQHREPKKTDNNANQTHYYKTLVVAIVLGLIGVFIRFVPDVCTSLDQHVSMFSTIANICVIVATLIAFRTVFGILGFGKNK
ncbi:hypothetical protein ACFX5U_03765 [Sphingobacterium sp. SG20118]|uniref:hypothetical protein n=1 Tax=Sphingobacterium TaxID=28453 RepID=UPI0004F8F2F2|nr:MULTISPECIES: hypothetical protein [Sphingobacterium]AIM36161.1 hypothetical protein KO02_05200 [Sphingobacterium sp. ML3W]MDH5827698.1 hypothetical protein [Sphingobacterium faecium]